VQNTNLGLDELNVADKHDETSEQQGFLDSAIRPKETDVFFEEGWLARSTEWA